MSGFGNRQQAETEQNRQRPTAVYDNRWKVVMKLDPGESVIGRFKIGKEYPKLYKRHSHASTGDYNTICGRPEGCLLCDAVDQMDLWYNRNRRNSSAKPTDTLKASTDRAVFGFYSTRAIFLVPNGEKTKRVARAVDKNGNTFHMVNRGNDRVVEYYPGNRHELDGVFPFVYEGLVAFDCGNSKFNPQTKPVFDAEDRLSRECKCGTQVADGLVRRSANVIRNADGNVVGCEANCGNPGCWSVSDCWVRITRVGSGTDTDYEMEFYPPNGDIPEEYRSVFINEKGEPHTLDLSAFDGDRSLQANTIMGLRDGLSRFGVDVNGILNGTPSNPQQQVQQPSGFGGLPNFGGPTTAQPPRVAAPAPAFAPPGTPAPSAPPAGQMSTTMMGPSASVVPAGGGQVRRPPPPAV